MDDDKVVRSHPSDPTISAMTEITLRDADQQVRTFYQAIKSLAAFGRVYWSLDQVLSWITYRDPFHLYTPYLQGIKYPTMLGIPPVIEPVASSKLLQAVTRSGNAIVCFKNGEQVHGSEWGAADYPSNPKRWPQGFFDRSDVLREWPDLRLDPEANPDLTSRQHIASGSPTIPEPSPAERRRAATKTLPPGLNFETGRKMGERSSPFSEALADKLGETPTRAECLVEWDFYKPKGKRGRPKNVAPNATRK